MVTQAQRGWAIWVRLYSMWVLPSAAEAPEGESPLIVWLRA